ncbi:hypothetical protein EVJ58_g2781 [Rhodofomes roseus]|uniref:Peptidase C14 caspase domain-containing protein n=1 Tax=Rhodofomes roseus TaxID=34475 RepID=A0A4Y9YQX2_9APHY|nr:hypothetical protein EVJ58_g2781 [Rhodofomes roseus]
MERVQGEDIWALIIGIDEYEDPELFRRLNGCRNDSVDVYRFLRDTLHVPQRNIKMLHDKVATRSEILESFEEIFIKNHRITQRSVALFYFAGHGARVTIPQTARTGAQKRGTDFVESICPYDEGTYTFKLTQGDGFPVFGIPQRTLQRLFGDLEQEKKCNVVVVLDSCHSGGVFPDDPWQTRIPWSIRTPLAPWKPGWIRAGSYWTQGGWIATGSVRVSYPVALYPPVVPANLDETIVRKAAKVSVTQRHSDPDTQPRTKGVSQHTYVVLAACGKHQLAHEVADRGGTQRGAFTLELVRVLRELQRKGEKKNYLAIISALKLGTLGAVQQPECRGSNSFKRFFMHYMVNRAEPLQPHGNIHGTAADVTASGAWDTATLHGTITGTPCLIASDPFI